MYHETLSATDEQLDPGLKRPSPVQAITSFLGCNQEWINTTADKISLWWDCRIPRKRSLTEHTCIVYRRILMMPPRLIKNNLQWEFVRYYLVLSHRHAVILVGVKAADIVSERRDYIVCSYLWRWDDSSNRPTQSHHLERVNDNVTCRALDPPPKK